MKMGKPQPKCRLINGALSDQIWNSFLAVVSCPRAFGRHAGAPIMRRHAHSAFVFCVVLYWYICVFVCLLICVFVFVHLLFVVYWLISRRILLFMHFSDSVNHIFLFWKTVFLRFQGWVSTCNSLFFAFQPLPPRCSCQIYPKSKQNWKFPLSLASNSQKWARAQFQMKTRLAKG